MNGHLGQFGTRNSELGTGDRRGFTLVELMVVISIIGILAGFISAAAMSAIGKAREASIRGDIDALSIGVETYKQRYGSYPPNLQDVAAVKQHVYKLFPRCKDAIPSAVNTATGGAAATGSLWRLKPGNASSVFEVTGSEIPLEMWERNASILALPLWLGGFYPDPEHPFSPPKDVNGNYIANAQRVAIFDFKPGRLRATGVAYRPDASVAVKAQAGTTPPTDITKLGILYAYYPEGLDTPYVYFNASRYDPRDLNPLAAYSYASVNLDGSYEAGTTAGSLKPIHLRYARMRTPADDLSMLTFPLTLTGASPDVSETVCLPYRARDGLSYVNPNSFQIICAGADNKYSGIWISNIASYPLFAQSNDGLMDSSLTGTLTHGDLYVKYLNTGGIYYFPTGSPPITVSDTTRVRGPLEHKDNLTNFTPGRIEAAVP